MRTAPGTKQSIVPEQTRTGKELRIRQQSRMIEQTRKAALGMTKGMATLALAYPERCNVPFLGGKSSSMAP